ncbi:hypothetical protein J2Z40_002941 [Cytobacillus eiseniae]|uniref:Uncharacterized protein n=1 Tax=Cytobacillus eiseniae TaxID=762947 RepID=A0ABS4RHH6_9BACI|nr:hypothetical protein [Cytobacillus eiseniae]MBP2242367.1 hypothetical protein [Cytobacillus eiseniae]
MEPIIIEQDDIKNAIQSGHSYIQVGNKKFLLLEVEEINNYGYYEVTDPEEEKQLSAAINENNPILSEEEIEKMIGN